MKPSRSLSLLALTALAGCVNLPANDTVTSSAAQLPSHWRTAGVSEGAEVATWWNGFSDAQLRALIDKALLQNYELKSAVERSRQAQALITATRSSLYPELNLTADAVRQRTHLPPPGGNITQAAIGVEGAWNIDVFGGDQLEALAASAEASATEEARRDFEVALTANVASAYVQLRGLQRQRAILEQTIAARADTLHLTRVRYEAGLATDLDVSRAETQLRQVEASVPDVERQIENELGTLAILTGEPPQAIDHALLTAAPIPQGTPPLPQQAPADLLQRRPDLRAAARRVDAASARLGSARSDLLPKFTLAFAASEDRLEFHGLPGVTDGLFNVGLGIFWPLFNAGRIHANITAHDAALRQAQYAFDQTLLNALQDVESAYTDARANRERTDRLNLAVKSAQRSSQLAEDLYNAGRADFLSVLETHTQVFETERNLAQAQTAAAISAVSLYRALGGGWTS